MECGAVSARWDALPRQPRHSGDGFALSGQSAPARLWSGRVIAKVKNGGTRVSPLMRRGWQVTSLIMLLICILTGWEAHNLALFDRLGPGPGFFPFWLAILGGGLCAVILIQVSLRPAGSPEGDAGLVPSASAAWSAAAILLATGATAALLDFLGFRITITLFSAVLLVALGDRRWWLIPIFAVIAGFGLFHLFNNWLDVLLPIGVFGI